MLKQEIEAVLSAYIDAFNSCDAPRISSLYNVPSLTVRADGSIHEFRTIDEVREFMGAVAKTYHDEGNRAGIYRDLEVVPLGNHAATATVTWVLRTAGGLPIREWRQTYNLVLDDTGWKFLLTTFHRG